jgi:hypothetical protein
MSGTKMLRGNVSVYAFYPEALTNWASPGAAALNTAITNGLGFDISCAIEDTSLTLGLTASETDTSISICDIGNVTTPTFFNYQASFDSFRNGPTSAGAAVAVYELPVVLFSDPDHPFYLIKRIGVPQGTTFASGQVVNIYGVSTDNPIDTLADGANILFGSRFVPNGQVYTNATLAA